MLPAAPSQLQAHVCRSHLSRLAAFAATLMALGHANPALAQESVPEAGVDISLPPQVPAHAVNAEAGDQIAFEADEIRYLEDEGTVIASGDVLLRREGESVRADAVTWNRSSGIIVATGDVRLVDEDGNQLFTDRVELTDELRTGAMENLLLALREGGRLAAVSGERLEDGNIVLERAAYSACPVMDRQGCPKDPTWRVTAREVVYDAEENYVRFAGARLVFFGEIAIPIPGLRISTDGGATSGLLIPDLRTSPSNGVEISQPYYIRLAENRDITVTAHVYTEAPPMASVHYRALTDRGAYQVTGYATASRRIPIYDAPPTAESAFRGYIFANGALHLDEHWSITGSIRRATDRTFLRRYDISEDDRLRSMVEVERIDDRTYFSLAGWATQTMRVHQEQGQIPIALPVIDYRHRLADPVLGGRVELQANSLAIVRTEGQDTRRAFASARWDMRRLTGMGQEFTLTALARGDIYHSDENHLTETLIYRGQRGWQGRAVAIGAVDVKWPLVGSAFGGTHVLTPRVQLVATPPIRNLAVPNEDARSIDLEDSNLFALNRFPGYDRVEEGVRLTYGVDWQFERPRWRIKTTVGQSIRLSDEPTLLPDGTGLTDEVSDFVGRTEVRYRNLINLVHRFRLDKDNFAVRRNEFDAAIGNRRTYVEVGYVKLNRDIAEGLEDLQDREELRGAARVAFARYWSVFGSAVVNLTNRRDDPVLGSDGFQPLRTRLGAAYRDDCLEVAVTWRRDYVTTGDAERGDSFQIHFALRNIGI